MITVRKLVAVCALFLAVGTSACAEGKTINGKYYEPYGLVDRDEVRSPDVQYRLSNGSVALSIIFGETVAVPIWLVGFQLYEPVGPAQTEVSK